MSSNNLKGRLKKLSLTLVACGAMLGLPGCSDSQSEQNEEDTVSQKEMIKLQKESQKELLQTISAPNLFKRKVYDDICSNNFGECSQKEPTNHELAAVVESIYLKCQDFSNQLRSSSNKTGIGYIERPDIKAFSACVNQQTSMSLYQGTGLPMPPDYYQKKYGLTNDQVIRVFKAYTGFISEITSAESEDRHSNAAFYRRFGGKALLLQNTFKKQFEKEQKAGHVLTYQGSARDY